MQMRSSRHKQFKKTQQMQQQTGRQVHDGLVKQGLFAPLSRLDKSSIKQVPNMKRTDKKKGNTKPKSSKQCRPNQMRKSEVPKYEQSALKTFQMIVQSQTYQKLSEQYSTLKKQHQFQMNKLKKQINELTQDIYIKQTRQTTLHSMRQHLASELNYLSQIYNDLKLNNYDMLCELSHRRGYDQEQRYDSMQEINWDQLSYQEIMELQERWGAVDLGYNSKIIQNMPAQFYENCSEEQKCCICFSELQEGDQIFKTQCKHVHHRECLQKWLSHKRFCPLCRQQIQLQ